MSTIKLINKSGGQLVCDLNGDKKTLRLDNNKSMTINDTEMTKHIKNLVDKGILISEEVAEPKSVKNEKTTVQKKNSKEKEE